jgi:hypothetical protein
MNNEDTQMKITIKMPGFTAEAAVPGVRRHYQATESPVLCTGTVHTAIRGDAGLPCLKFKCTGFPFLNCHTTVGHVNPSTGRCE